MALMTVPASFLLIALTFMGAIVASGAERLQFSPSSIKMTSPATIRLEGQFDASVEFHFDDLEEHTFFDANVDFVVLDSDGNQLTGHPLIRSALVNSVNLSRSKVGTWKLRMSLDNSHKAFKEGDRYALVCSTRGATEMLVSVRQFEVVK